MKEKLNKVVDTFSIRDLENLSGIKAHTIRMWENRYNLLQPIRTQTNIRRYGMAEMKRLLNIVHLYNQGSKISNLAGMTEKELSIALESAKQGERSEQYYISKLKTLSLEFDELGFNKLFKEITDKYGFFNAFELVFLPFLSEVGLDWLTNKMYPVHEHFISSLIKRKLQHFIELQDIHYGESLPEFTLFLPPNELHEIHLMYSHAILRSKGYQTCYLGQSLPVEELTHYVHKEVLHYFITGFTIRPRDKDLSAFWVEVERMKGKRPSSKILIVMKKEWMEQTRPADGVIVLNNLKELIEFLAKDCPSWNKK